MTTAAHLSLTAADLAGIINLLKLLSASKLLEHLDRILGARHTLGTISDDEGELANLANAVTAGHDKWREGACGKSNRDGVTLLLHVDAAVPAAPSLGWGEHTSTTAHVTECRLPSTVGTTTWDTRDTGDSATSSPRLGGSAVTGLGRDGVGLTVILRHTSVDRADQVWAERGAKDGWHLHGTLSLRWIIVLENRDGWSVVCHDMKR